MTANYRKSNYRKSNYRKSNYRESSPSKLERFGSVVRKAVAPTPQEMNERTRTLRKVNDAYEERVRALESRKREYERLNRLREREEKSRQPVSSSRASPIRATSSRTSNSRVRIGDPTRAFDTFANHPLFGGGTTQYNDAFSTHPLFGGGGTTQRKSKQQPPKEFDWNLI